MAIIRAIDVSFETYKDNKIIEVQAPLMVMYNRGYDMFFCNFPQYSTADYQGKTIAVCSNGFTDISYSKPDIAFVHDRLLSNNAKLKKEDVIALMSILSLMGLGIRI